MRHFQPGRRATLRAAPLLALVLGLASPALAQEAPRSETSAAAPDDAPRVFPRSFFAAYNPTTAGDMVARIPGFELRDGDDRRGFGATAGNVLVNGERPSSKTAVSELLKRIPAANVLRIELLSGADAAADVRGQSQIVNVVLSQATQRDSSTSYVLGLRHINYSDRTGYTIQLSRTFALWSKAELAVDFQSPNMLGRTENRDVLRDAAGVVTGSRFLVSRPNSFGATGSANLHWKPTPSDSVGMNLQLAPITNFVDSDQFEGGADTALRSRIIGHTDYGANYTGELGADWEHRFTPAFSAKLITLISNGGVDQSDIFDIFTAPTSNLRRTQDRSTRNGERIGRARLKWTGLTGHSLEVGGEGAFNYRETTLDITNQPQGGVVTRVPLAVANARVEEVRGEAFVTDIWAATPKLTIEGGLNFEVSRITQTGDQQKERTFSYPKPRVSATYNLNARNVLRLSLTRDVAQLDFAEFSSAIDFVNTSSTQGNPDLEPEKAWKSRIEWESRMSERTALTVAAFADKVEDVHDLVEISGLDAFGNIGDGSRIGVEFRAATPVTLFGVKNAELRVNGLYQRTRVTDPITGQARSFSIPLERQSTGGGSGALNSGNKDWAYVVNFRQNLPSINSSWGASIAQSAGRREYRRGEILSAVRARPRLDLFAETSALKPVTLRIFLNNALVSTERRTRTFFRESRATTPVQRIEDRVIAGGTEGSVTYGFQVAGRF